MTEMVLVDRCLLKKDKIHVTTNPLHHDCKKLTRTLRIKMKVFNQANSSINHYKCR